MLRFLCLVGLLVAASSSPFELTEKYIDDFIQGMERLRNTSKETVLGETVYDSTKYDPEAAEREAEEFDFVVVGAGTSGAVVANRLSEVPEWKVLLLEAGAPESTYGRAPSFTHVLLNTHYNWGYKTEPQEKSCLGSINNQCNIPTGKAMGGTSAINRMLYSRGCARDYDIWADLGNDGWCYKDVLPIFKQSEDARLHNFEPKHHNQGGLLHVEEPQHHSHVREAFLQASKELGYKTIDPNGDEAIGFATPQQVTKYGKRNSVSRAYLEPVKDRKNLIVRPFSQVINLLIAPHTKDATGVKYIHGTKMHIAKSKKEIILATGSINTPQLLMLSGIGPKDHLLKVGIDCIQDLAVGNNLRDHLAFIGLNFILNESLPDSNPKEDLITWLREGKGPLSHTGFEALGLIKTDASKDSHNYPDVELLLLNHAFNGEYEPLLHEYNLRKELYDTHWAPIKGKPGFTIAVVLLHPKSTGDVKLKSRDPFNFPIINANYLSDEEGQDMQTMLAGIRKALVLSQTEAFKKIGAELYEHPIQGCEKHTHGSDDYWKCVVHHLTVSVRTPTGTCKMGPNTDKEAVVDNRLKVYGVNKLRVVDASVIPNSLSAHLEAPTVMIGEKAADLIKHEWK